MCTRFSASFPSHSSEPSLHSYLLLMPPAGEKVLPQTLQWQCIYKAVFVLNCTSLISMAHPTEFGTRFYFFSDFNCCRTRSWDWQSSTDILADTVFFWRWFSAKLKGLIFHYKVLFFFPPISSSITFCFSSSLLQLLSSDSSPHSTDNNNRLCTRDFTVLTEHKEYSSYRKLFCDQSNFQAATSVHTNKMHTVLDTPEHRPLHSKIQGVWQQKFSQQRPPKILQPLWKTDVMVPVNEKKVFISG